MQGNMGYRLSIRLFADNDAKCFGPGVAELLSRVERTRSLRAASIEMGMAYSKAWRIMKDSEAALGIKLINSTTGGHNGGGAQLTEEGRDMLRRYNALVERLDLEAQKLVGELFW